MALAQVGVKGAASATAHGGVEEPLARKQRAILCWRHEVALMFTEQEKQNLKTGDMIRKWCDCGTLIWEVPSERFLPRYIETIICHTCGKDWSRKGPFLWKFRLKLRRKIRRGLGRLAKVV